jgi:choline dehydrogenase-like flavoprotein
MEIPDSSSMVVPQAKLMGGGSSINGGTALRSTWVDSDEWVAMGNDAGDFDCVYHVYQPLENDPVRGTRGPRPIIRASEHEIGKIQKAFLIGAYQRGFPLVLDLNALGAEVAGPSLVCRRDDDCVLLTPAAWVWRCLGAHRVGFLHPVALLHLPSLDLMSSFNDASMIRSRLAS